MAFTTATPSLPRGRPAQPVLLYDPGAPALTLTGVRPIVGAPAVPGAQRGPRQDAGRGDGFLSVASGSFPVPTANHHCSNHEVGPVKI